MTDCCYSIFTGCHYDVLSSEAEAYALQICGLLRNDQLKGFLLFF